LKLTEVTIPGQTGAAAPKVYFGFDGDKLIIALSRDVVDKLTSSGSRLTEDPLFKETLDSAGVPDNSLGYIYLNVDSALSLPGSHDRAAVNDHQIPAIVSDNLVLVHSAVVFSQKTDAGMRTDLFVTIH